jgi:hypothetical protein
MAKLADIFGPAGTDQIIVSIDWITQCVREDQQVGLEPYRIALPSVIPTPDVKMEVEVGPTLSSVPPAVQHAEIPAQRSNIPSPHVKARPALSTIPPSVSRARNAIAGPAGVIRSTAPRDIIKIENDDDDDCIMIEALPPPKARAKDPVSGANHPSPPRTPFEDSVEALNRLAPGTKTSLSSLAPDSDDEDDEDEDLRLLNPRPQYQHDPLSANGPPPIITDPAEREHMMQSLVQTNNRRPFEQLELKLHEWKEQNFRGTLKAFFERMKVEVSPSHYICGHRQLIR